jgi:cytochrome c5
MLDKKSLVGVLVCFFSSSLMAESHHPEEFIRSLQNDPEAGKKIYQQFCSTCHAKDPQIELGAPKIGVKKDWNARIKKGIDELLIVTKAGLNQMPPRGGCFECSDEQLKSAIAYMLPPIPKSAHKSK